MRIQTFFLLLPVIFLPASFSTTADAFTINVPADSLTIQAGIDGAAAGDTVLVADGTYSGPGNVAIDFLGKRITVRTESASIDCANESTGFYFISGEDSLSILEGFTVGSGATTGYGGGMVIAFDSSPVIGDCAFTRCDANYGGAVYCAYGAEPRLEKCVLDNNTGNMGGGIFCYFASPVLVNCNIVDNTGFQGGGMACQTSFPEILNCTFSGNEALIGGGIKMYWSDPVITSTILWGDYPDELFGYDSSPAVTFSDVEGGWPGEGNFDADPEFRGEDDYHISATSPCLDNGTDTGAIDDIDGQVRPQGSGFEAGSDEFQPGGLEAFVADYPDTINTGEILSFTAGVMNTGSETASFDEAEVRVDGPMVNVIPLYSGSPIQVDPLEDVSTTVNLNVPPSALEGDYTISVVIYLAGSEVSSDSFELYISQ